MLLLLPLQATPWFPTWATPIWILGVGVAAGFLASLAILLVLAVLSRVPGLGTLADRPGIANVVAGILTLGIASGVLAIYLPLADADYRLLMIVPVLVMSAMMSWGIIYGMWRRTIREIFTALTEGVMGYLLGCLGLVMLVGLGLTPAANDTAGVLASLRQINWTSNGESTTRVNVAPLAAEVTDPDDAPFQKFVVPYDADGVDQVTIETDKTIIIADAESPQDFVMRPMRIDPGTPFKWKRGEMSAPPLPIEASDGVWIQNREIDEAVVSFQIVTKPPVREVSTIVTTALSVVLLIFGYIAFRQASPRIAAIALSTAKSEMAQPLYLVLLVIGIVSLAVFMILPFNTLGEDIKMMKDSGMTLIMVLGMIQAVWSAGTSVAEEIEGRTALTVLSKPVSRRSFLIGKYTGIIMSVLVMFVIMGVLLMAITAYKPIFEARENSTDQPVWQFAHLEMVSVIPGLVLYFMETMAIGAIGVALATRVAMLANFLICFTVYVVGNLTSPLVQSAAGENELVGFVGKLIAVIIPNLNSFNVQSAVDVGNAVPLIYLAGAFNYLVCFGVLALMVALLLFEDRDLA